MMIKQSRGRKGTGNSKETTPLMEYEAFISYKRSAMDQKLAASLEKGLKSYAKPLLKPAIKIFRDDKELRPGDDLSASLKTALENSRYFLYLASREAAQSLWIQRELRYWCENLGRAENLIICHIADNIDVDVNNGTINWETTDALPVFLGQFIKPLPVYIDLTWATGIKELDLDNIRFREKINALRARFQNKKPSEMNDEHVLVHRKNQRLKIVAQVLIMTLTVVSILFAVYAYHQKETAIKEKNRAVVNSLVSEARRQIPIDNVKAIRISESAYEKSGKNPPPAVIAALSEAAYSTWENPFYVYTMKHKRNTDSKHNSLAVRSVTFSPNSRYILTASKDNTAKVWDTDTISLRNDRLTMAEPWTLNHDKEVLSALFSPSGKYVVTASYDGIAALWKLKDLKAKKKEPFRKLHHGRYVSIATFSSDSQIILSAGLDGTSKLWDSEGKLLCTLDSTGKLWDSEGKLLCTLDSTGKLWDSEEKLLCTVKHKPPPPVNRGAVTAATFINKKQGNVEVLTGYSDGTIQLWNSKKILWEEKQDNNTVTAVAFSPEKKLLLTGYKDGSTKLWDLQRRREYNSWKDSSKHYGYIWATRFSADGRFVLTASEDGTAKIRHLNGTLKAEIRHKRSITSAVFTPAGDGFLTASQDNTAKLWDLDGNLICNFFRHIDSVWSAEFSPDGRFVATASDDGTAILWNMKDRFVSNFTIQKKIVNDLDISKDSEKALTASDDGKATLWSMEGEKVLPLDVKEEIIKSQSSTDKESIHIRVEKAFFAPHNENIIVTMSHDPSGSSAIMLWKQNGTLIRKISREEKLSSISISPDGHYLLAISEDGFPKLYDLKSDNSKPLPLSHIDATAAVFSYDGRKIMTMDKKKNYFMWNLNRERIRILKAEKEVPEDNRDTSTFGIFSPKDKYILIGSIGNKVLLLNAEGKELKRMKHEDNIRAASFSPDGKYILTTSDDGVFKLWNLDTGELKLEKKAHQDRVTRAIFSPDGSMILTYSFDKTCNLWTLDGKLLATMDKHLEIVSQCVFSPDGKYILSRSTDRTIKKWYTPKGISDKLKSVKIPKLSPEEKMNSSEHKKKVKNNQIKIACYPCVIDFGDQYKMWFADRKGGVFITCSKDGKNWSKPLKCENLKSSLRHPVITYHSDIDYRIYYWTYDFNYLSTRTAKSEDGIKWVDDKNIKQDKELFLKGDDYYSYWFQHYGPRQVIYQPNAANIGGNPWDYSYVMFFDTVCETLRDGIGFEHTAMAYSADGLTWSRYGTEPVLKAENRGTWDDDYAYHGMVVKGDGKWWMFYSGSDRHAMGRFYAQGIGLAVSDDGLSWKKIPYPIIQRNDEDKWRNERTFTPWAIYKEKKFKVWFSGNNKIGYFELDVSQQKNIKLIGSPLLLDFH